MKIMRGYVFCLCGKRFFAFGGASSHDVSDGILDAENYKDINEFRKVCKRWQKVNKIFRVNHESWWKEELPSENEMQRGREYLKMVDYKVDYVISHCLPQSIVETMYEEKADSDILTNYFESLLQEGLRFDKWYAGHYHSDVEFSGNYAILYNKITRIL